MTGRGGPPGAGTRSRAELGAGGDGITPSAFRVRPRPRGASQRTCGGPPEMSILLSFPGTKNPTERLSGDQKGKDASSVSLSGWAVRASSVRIHRIVSPEESFAAKTRRVPSGERTG